MGTNVMEEFAFGINLLVRTDMPIVFTGAMRTPDMRGADGPGNLISGIRVAASDNCKDLGDLGFDNLTGYGLFVLPEPATINVKKYLTRNDVNNNIIVSPTFADLDNHWSKQYVDQLQDGIMNGYIGLDGKSYFKPDEPLKRGELAKILVKLGYTKKLI
jgi:hypothetical protein